MEVESEAHNLQDMDKGLQIIGEVVWLQRIVLKRARHVKPRSLHRNLS